MSKETMLVALGALEAARDRIACSVCHHDETQRRGLIWTECLQCGGMFADDRGGVPKPAEPKELEQIRSAISLLSAAVEEPQGEPVVHDMPSLIERIEDRVGMGCGAWDMVNAADLVRAVIAEAHAAPQKGSA